ncbi:vacuolar protein sorting-associated protein 35A-like protein [Tanacetum coccineum]
MALQLVRRIQSQDDNGSEEETASATPKKIFQILNQTIEVLSTVPVPDLALRLYLECADAANDCDLEPVAYEFFTQAYILYEEEISDSKAQVTAIYLIIGTLQRMHIFGVENRDTLTHKATGYSAKLLKKPDQCRAVYACSHLFWVDDQDGIKDGERYLYFFEKGNTQITVASIQGLIELVTTEIQSDSTTSDPAADAFFASTIRYIQSQKDKGGATGEKFETYNKRCDFFYTVNSYKKLPIPVVTDSNITATTAENQRSKLPDDIMNMPDDIMNNKRILRTQASDTVLVDYRINAVIKSPTKGTIKYK